MAALLYLILLAGLGGSLFLFFSSRGGDEDMTLVGLGGAAVSFVLLCLLFLVRKIKKGRAKEPAPK